jgi:hypothetical protein
MAMKNTTDLHPLRHPRVGGDLKIPQQVRDDNLSAIAKALSWMTLFI